MTDNLLVGQRDPGGATHGARKLRYWQFASIEAGRAVAFHPDTLWTGPAELTAMHDRKLAGSWTPCGVSTARPSSRRLRPTRMAPATISAPRTRRRRCCAPGA